VVHWAQATFPPGGPSEPLHLTLKRLNWAVSMRDIALAQRREPSVHAILLPLELATIPWLLGFLDKRGYLATSSIRVLLVDDYEPFRRFARSTLERSPSLQIIGEASDGLEAVQKAEQLQPDLVVLDIGLPTLNGIEAARRIRKLCPASRILFVSQESSADVVQEALSTGALGYVIKAHAGSELRAAVQAVRQGRHFLRSGLSRDGKSI
jgi:CheY-like chemotaxis protein